MNMEIPLRQCWENTELEDIATPAFGIEICDFHVPHNSICFPYKSFVFTPSRDDCYSYESLKRILMQNFVGKTNCIMGNVKVENWSPKSHINSNSHEKIWQCVRNRSGVGKQGNGTAKRKHVFVKFILGFLLTHTAWTGVIYGYFCVAFSFVNDCNFNVR